MLTYLSWLLCSVYCTIPLFWLSIHPFTKHWRARGRSAYRILLPLWGLYVVIALVLTWPWLNQRLYHHWGGILAGLALVALGLLALLAFALITGAIMLHVEDSELEQRFGPTYSNYRRSVPAIIPRLF